MMNTHSKHRTLVLVTVCLILLVASMAEAKVMARRPDVIRMIVGESTIINTEANVSRISLASDSVAAIVVISPRQIYLTGTAIGSTTLTLWSGKEVSDIYDVVVDPDTSRLKRMIHELMPEEKNVKVLTSGDTITLSGYVSNTANLSSVLALAEAAAPEKVVNLLTVDGIQQVMLEVRVAEMSRSVTKRLGVNFAAIGSNFSIYSIINNLTSYNADDNVYELTDNINFTGTYSLGGTSILGMIDALKAHGLVRVLAEPNLTCVSGESAEFLVGGEIPLPMPGSLGTVGIVFKPFGVGLKFTATVMGSGAHQPSGESRGLRAGLLQGPERRWLRDSQPDHPPGEHRHRTGRRTELRGRGSDQRLPEGKRQQVPGSGRRSDSGKPVQLQGFRVQEDRTGRSRDRPSGQARGHEESDVPHGRLPGTR